MMDMLGKKKHSEKGFTLIEMAIVLVVIGLILGAVSIGKDVQRNAEYTKIKQKFVDGWAQAYNAYYQRTGVVLGDDQTAPRFMVNGANYASATSTLSGGNMGLAAVAAPGYICQGTPLAGPTAGSNALTAMHDFFDQAGIRMPPGRAEGSEDRYVYLDTNGNPQELQVCFQWNKPGQATAGINSGNVMVITGLTPDLARALDQMIDGKPDATQGMFRQEGLSTTAGSASAAWNQTNTGFISTSGGTAGNDENQVIVVIAEYKMNQ